jgi:hypothetical protein
VKQVRKRLTYANVMSSIAVFLVIGGGAAFAAAKNSIGTRELKPNSVNRAILARNSVYPGKINPEAVKAGRIAKNAIARDRLRNGIVSTDKLADLGVTGDKLANLAVTNPKIFNFAVTKQKIANNAVSEEKIADDAVTNPKIAADTVSQQKLQANSVGASQFKGLVTRTNSVTVNAGTSNATSVACQGGEQIISAGIHWNAFEANLETNYIRIVGNSAVGRGNNDTGTNRTLFVDAYCLSN